MRAAAHYPALESLEKSSPVPTSAGCSRRVYHQYQSSTEQAHDHRAIQSTFHAFISHPNFRGNNKNKRHAMLGTQDAKIGWGVKKARLEGYQGN